MSHELRTPLNAIIGFSEMMRNEVLGAVGNEQYRSYVGDITPAVRTCCRSSTTSSTCRRPTRGS
jgi:signal transduction histidine kinase